MSPLSTALWPSTGTSCSTWQTGIPRLSQVPSSLISSSGATIHLTIQNPRNPHLLWPIQNIHAYHSSPNVTFQISLKSVCTSLSMPLLSHYRSLPSSRFPPPASSPSSVLTCSERLCSHPLCFLHCTLFMLSKTILFTHLPPVLCPSLHYDVSTLWSGTCVTYFLYCSIPITWTNSCLERVLKRYLFTE